MAKHIFRVPVDTEHFRDTIQKGKWKDDIMAHLSEPDATIIASLTNYSMLRYWGSKPGSSNIKVFEQMKEGDELICYRDGHYIAAATIAYKTVSPDLARYSWEEAKDGRTWELIYFLRDVSFIWVEAQVLNSEWGYKNGPVMGLSKLSDGTAQPFLAKYGSVAGFLAEAKAA